MTETIAQTVPAALRAELGRREITKAAFAKRLNKTSDWVRRRLGGTVEITLSDLDLMCRNLGLTPTQLLIAHDLLEARPAKKNTPKKTAAAGGRRRPRTQPPSAERNGQ